MSCSRRYFRIWCYNRLTLKSQWIDTTDAYFSLVLPDQVRVKRVWKAGSAPHSHSVIQAEGDATTWSLASYHGRTRLTENSYVGLPWWFIALPLQEAQVRSLVGKLRSHMPRGQKKKKENQCVTFSVTSTEVQRSHPGVVWSGLYHHHHAWSSLPFVSA